MAEKDWNDWSLEDRDFAREALRRRDEQATETDQMRDLRDRLAKAASLLDASVDTYWEATERTRVRGKAQGVRLALSYVDEALRLPPDKT